MKSNRQLKQKYLLAVQYIRRQNLAKGFPFMINTGELPPGQCFMEFPNGTIQVFTICPVHYDFKLVRELSPTEATLVKEKLLLIS